MDDSLAIKTWSYFFIYPAQKIKETLKLNSETFKLKIFTNTQRSVTENKMM